MNNYRITDRNDGSHLRSDSNSRIDTWMIIHIIGMGLASLLIILISVATVDPESFSLAQAIVTLCCLVPALLPIWSAVTLALRFRSAVFVTKAALVLMIATTGILLYRSAGPLLMLLIILLAIEGLSLFYFCRDPQVENRFPASERRIFLPDVLVTSISFIPVLVIIASLATISVTDNSRDTSRRNPDEKGIKEAYHPGSIFHHENLKSRDIEVFTTRAEVRVDFIDPPAEFRYNPDVYTRILIEGESDGIVEDFMLAQPQLTDRLISSRTDLNLTFAGSRLNFDNKTIKVKWENLASMRARADQRKELESRYRSMAESRLDSVTEKVNTSLPRPIAPFMTLEAVTVTDSEVICRFSVDDSGSNLVKAWEVLEPGAESVSREAEEYEPRFIEMFRSRLRGDMPDESMREMSAETDFALTVAATGRSVAFEINGRRTGYRESRQLIPATDFMSLYEFVERPWQTDRE